MPSASPSLSRLAELRATPVRELRSMLREMSESSEGRAAYAPVDKEELVGSVEALERAARAKGKLARQAECAWAEVEAMRERVRELEEMASAGEWRQLEEHAAWLLNEYPLHTALRGLRLLALASLERVGEAAELCEQMLQAAVSS